MTTTAQERIHAVATAHGWTTRTGDTPSGACEVEYRKGSRRVWIYYGVRGTVTSASWQTGSYGGRHARPGGKEAQVTSRLQESRWTG